MKQKPKPKPVGKQLQVHQAINDALLRVGMPSSPEAEKGLLMSFFAQNDLLDRPHKEEWFHNPRNLACYRAMVHVRRTGRPVEYVGVARKLFMDGIMEEGPALAFTSELDKGNLASPQLYSHYLEIILGDHLSRAAIQGGINMMEAGFGDPSTVGDAAKESLQAIASASHQDKKVKGMEEEMEEWEHEWNEMAKGRKPSALPTRWKCWNHMMMGIRSGYSVIMGRRGSGKTCLVTNILTDAALIHNMPCMLFSFEMKARQVINRILADIGGVHGAYLFSPDLFPPNDDIKRNIGVAMQKFRKCIFSIVHDVTLYPEDVEGKIRAFHAKHGKCAVGVDYIQLLKPCRTRKHETREQEIAGISATFRNLSKELDIPMYALSQVNKDGTTRESNAPEQDCDDLFLIDRYKMPDGSTHEGPVICMKNRNGGDGPLPLKFRGETFSFYEASVTDSIP